MGLLTEQTQQPQPTEAPTEAPESDSPEWQEEYEKYVYSAMDVVSDEEISDSILDSVINEDGTLNPENTVDHIVAIVTELDERANNDIPEDMVFPIAVEVMGMIIEQAEAAGVTTDEQTMSDIMRSTLRGLLRHYGEEVSEEEFEQMAQELTGQGSQGAIQVAEQSMREEGIRRQSQQQVEA